MTSRFYCGPDDLRRGHVAELLTLDPAIGNAFGKLYWTTPALRALGELNRIGTTSYWLRLPRQAAPRAFIEEFLQGFVKEHGITRVQQPFTPKERREAFTQSVRNRR